MRWMLVLGEAGCNVLRVPKDAFTNKKPEKEVQMMTWGELKKRMKEAAAREDATVIIAVDHQSDIAQTVKLTIDPDTHNQEVVIEARRECGSSDE